MVCAVWQLCNKDATSSDVAGDAESEYFMRSCLYRKYQMIKNGTLEGPPGPLEPPTLVKTGTLERPPGPLESMTLVKLERWNAALGHWSPRPL